jgi:hypothetical protein
MSNDITAWISRISEPREEIGGMPVCPFANRSEYEIIETDGGDVNPPPWDFELIIYKLPDHYTEYEIIELTKEYNTLHTDMIFLPDPKGCYTEINGVQTNNGIHNLILCQWRDNLEKARNKLRNTTYYSYWADKYLQEILNT